MGVATLNNMERVHAVREELLRVLAENHMFNPAVFGSSARGEDTKNSDLDLMVSTDLPLGFFSLAIVQAQLSELVGVPVDLIYRESLKPNVVAAVLKEAIPL